MSYSAAMYISTYGISHLVNGDTKYGTLPDDFLTRVARVDGYVSVASDAYGVLYDYCGGFSMTGSDSYTIYLDTEREQDGIRRAKEVIRTSDDPEVVNQARNVLYALRAMREHRIELGLEGAEWWVS